MNKCNKALNGGLIDAQGIIKAVLVTCLANKLLVLNLHILYEGQLDPQPGHG